MERRTLLKASLALSALGLPGLPAFAASPVKPGKGEPFSFDGLKDQAKKLATQAYQSPAEKLPPTLSNLQPLDYQKIEFNKADALWSDKNDIDLSVRFFHTGMHFKVPVRMHAISPDGRAHLIPFEPSMFNYGDSGVDTGQLEGKHLGFAGWRLAVGDEKPSERPEVASFLGASYFRAIDKNMQYGLSARGLAVNTAEPEGEEFPDFTQFWFEQPDPDTKTVTVYALLDSPSATGAYRFTIDAGNAQGVIMDIEANVYTRKAIKRLGVAPMTSMYLKGTAQETARDTIYPRMHDSDRLSMWRGNGEWICRPLYNPQTIQFNTFQDENPKGFGLIQHDHDFDHYRDPVAWYNRRPSLWLEPKNDWGKGEIALMEMPTVGETVDNIVAFWVPANPVTPGETLTYDYRLYWWPEPPASPSLAEVDETWSGMGNVQEGWIPGDHSPEEYARRFAVDFTGKTLEKLDDNADVQVEVSASNGKISYTAVHAMDPIDAYRAVFDWMPTSSDTTPVTLRAYLKQGDQTLSETWLYQFQPPAPGDRHY
ncbi:glucan biosynthesis protein [Salinisphaera sp. Q1T1-3]|uniref:glucan biosynthesis protein n=1 Tax=Salinisphaera sp. Q1T1-3 TaxID=2321229 RepID=UPI000E751725|nr:glucan biosynthesis protein D [Salinisphaera sp. Q1T1-3]RJS93291.1 glucan biosynthesis protein D [Salinisphaera sp. Q1T1-3]